MNTTRSTITQPTISGPASDEPSDGSVTSFRIEVAPAALEDLHERLTRTRLPQPAPGDSWEHGTPNAYLAGAVVHWLERYDWRAQEERLNTLPRFRTEVDGQVLAFIHVESPHPGATPLLLAHSYPGSSADFVDMIAALTDPVAHGGRARDAFSVVVPDAPGYGFSQPVRQAGWSTARTARAYDTLMRRLGYESYGVHGNDRGAMLARELGVLAPAGFIGLHVQQLFSFPSGDPAEMEQLGPEDFAALAHVQWFQSVGGYTTMNTSRPQTVAVGLSDSPVALLAYSELFGSFGNGTSLVSLDQVLTAVSIAWFTNAPAGMCRSYLEDARAEPNPEVNTSPTGVAVFAHDFTTIRTFAERDNSDIRHWSTFDRGGHYASLEAPDVLVGDIRAFFTRLREQDG